MGSDNPGLTVQPVFSGRDHGFCKASFLPDGRVVNASGSPTRLQPVAVGKDDIFLGLDLTAHVLPLAERQLAIWQRAGVSINFVVYDLLPVTQPNWFSPALVRNFNRWLGVIARRSDRSICISACVAEVLAQQLSRSLGIRPGTIETIPLGCNLDASFPSLGLPENSSAVRSLMQNSRTILAVGTIEPRKGYQVLLDAVEHIWRIDPNSDITLLIVGREGWRTGQLQQRLRNHPEQGKRLIWLDQASDEFLLEIYRNCAGLIAASHQEGFGLPLIEAAGNGAPVLARSLPVFREVGGQLFDYFDDDSPEPFATRIKEWIAARRRPSRADIDTLPRWKDSADALKAHLGLVRPARVSAP